MLTFFLFKLCCLTAMSGFLFGYDTGIVSGSMIFIKDEMELSTLWIEIIVSSTIAFAWITAWFSSNLIDLMGRKPLIMLASALFTLSSIIMGLAAERSQVIRSAIGLGSLTAPIYIAELSPKEKRGSLVTFNSSFITFGILGSSMIAYGFSHLPAHLGWRFMLGFASLPSLFQMIGFFFMPESPRYLCLQQKDEEALRVMTQIYGDFDRAKKEIKSIKESFSEIVNQNTSYFSKLMETFRDSQTRHCLLIGISLHIGQQVCGINTIMYYGATLIQMSGVLSKRLAIGFTVFVGIANATTSFIFLFIYDRVARRKITLWSMCGIVVCLALMGSMFTQIERQILPIYNHTNKYIDITDETKMSHINYCDQIDSCGNCVIDERCGYCFDSNSIYETGQCLPRSNDPLKSISNTFCANGTDEDTGIYFSTTNCPSDYGVYTLITLCLFLIWYAFGMGAMPWTINSEIYPMSCRGVAVSFATGFNWLSNLIVSISFLTITEYLSVSGAFFLYMSVSVLLTIVYYIWLPETKNKSMEGAVVFHH